MTSEMLTQVGNILSILDGMNEPDRATALAVISSRYTDSVHGKGPSVSKKPSGKGGGDSKASQKGKPAAVAEADFLNEVGRRLKPLLEKLPKVTRQQGAEKPHMDLKSVQKRLNRKRGELQKEFDRLANEPEEAYYAFTSLNAIQAFRIAAKDATATKGCRLPTDPLPPKEEFDQLVEILEKLAAQQLLDGKITSNGFFSDEDHDFSPPIEGEGNRNPGNQQTPSNEEALW
jgi:hypothetical protein